MSETTLQTESRATEQVLTPTDVKKSTSAMDQYKLGKIYYDKNDLAAAAKFFQKCLEDPTTQADTYKQLKILGFLIRISSECLDDANARTLISKTEMLLGQLTVTNGHFGAEYYYYVGSLHNYKGEFLEAAESLLVACRKAKEENEPDLLTKCLLSIAINSFNMNAVEKALGYLDELSEILRIVDKSYLRGSMHLYQGRCYLALKDYDKALTLFSRANEKLLEKKCWNMLGYLLLWKGIANKRLGDFSKSLLFFDLALETSSDKSARRLTNLVRAQIDDVNDATVDIYLDRANRKIKEKNLGIIDFKHRFVLLEILFLLAKNPGIYYNKDQLAQSIWGDEYNPLIHDKLIYTSVSRLRKLIEPSADEGKRTYIVRGKDGYTFNPRAKIRFLSEQGQTDQLSSIANVDISSPV